MKAMISSLVRRYESGSLTRRELIQGLAVLVAGAAASGEASGVDEAGKLQVSNFDHVSLQVSDVQRSVDFYQKTFNLPFLNEDKKTETVRLKVGKGLLAIRRVQPYGVADHFAFGVEPFDKAAVADYLKQRGVNALDTGEPLTFHVVDPDGYPVQIISTATRK